METEKIKGVCFKIIKLCKDFEKTNQKAEMNDLYIAFDLNLSELNKLIMNG